MVITQRTHAHCYCSLCDPLQTGRWPTCINHSPSTPATSAIHAHSHPLTGVAVLAVAVPFVEVFRRGCVVLPCATCDNFGRTLRGPRSRKRVPCADCINVDQPPTHAQTVSNGMGEGGKAIYKLYGRKGGIGWAGPRSGHIAIPGALKKGGTHVGRRKADGLWQAARCQPRNLQGG